MPNQRTRSMNETNFLCLENFREDTNNNWRALVQYSSISRNVEIQRIRTCSFCGQQQSTISRRKGLRLPISGWVKEQSSCWCFSNSQFKSSFGCVTYIIQKLENQTNEISIWNFLTQDALTTLKYHYVEDENIRTNLNGILRSCRCSHETLMRFDMNNGSIINLVPKFYWSRKINRAPSPRYALMSLYYQIYRLFTVATLNMLVAENNKVDYVEIEAHLLPVFIKPKLYIDHWLTRTKDMVLGYRLSDRSFGFSFKDGSAMIHSKDSNLYFISERGLITYYDDWDQVPWYLQRKVKMFSSLVKRLNDLHSSTAKDELSDEVIYNIPFVVKWLLLKSNMIVYFSDGTMEIHFDDEDGKRRLILAPFFKAISYGKMVGDEVHYVDSCENIFLLRKDLFVALNMCKRFVKFYYTRQIPFLFC